MYIIITVICNCTIPGKFSMHTGRKSVFPNTWMCCKRFYRNETTRHKRKQLDMLLFHQLICTVNNSNIITINSAITEHQSSSILHQHNVMKSYPTVDHKCISQISTFSILTINDITHSLSQRWKISFFGGKFQYSFWINDRHIPL